MKRSLLGIGIVIFIAVLLGTTAEARVRKSYSAMTAQEQANFVAALLALKAVDPGANTSALGG
jgi:hypothetical protein